MGVLRTLRTLSIANIVAAVMHEKFKGRLEVTDRNSRHLQNERGAQWVSRWKGQGVKLALFFYAINIS